MSSAIIQIIKRNRHQIRKVFFVALTALMLPLAILAVYALAFASLVPVCSLMGDVCNHKELGMAIVLFASVGFALVIGTLTMHFLAKVKWLASIESVAIGMMLLYIMIGLGSAVMLFDMLVFEIVTVCVFPFALMAIVCVAERLPRLMHIITIPLLVFLFFVPILTSNYTNSMHTEYEMQKGVEIKGSDL